MEIIISIISFLFISSLAFIPIFILIRLNKLKVKNKFIIFLIIGTVLTTLITIAYASWTDSSNKMLLAHYGYNFDGMSELEFYGQVSPKDMDRVKSLETSIMGIGWPLKAIMAYIIYMPYLFAVYSIGYIIKKQSKKITANSPQCIRQGS